MCHRCTKDQIKCDGYDSPQEKAKVPYNKSKKNVMPLLLRSLPVASGTVYLERLYFHHALLYTVRDLGDSLMHASFWLDHLPSSLHNAEGVRHALIALGAAHRSFLGGTRQPDAMSHNNNSKNNNDDERFILLHYNLAIRHIQPLMSNPTAANLHATLICCLLFICFENIRGRYAESVRHLQSGARLLSSLLAANTLPANSTGENHAISPQFQNAPATAGIQSPDMDRFIALFSCLGIDVSILVDDDVVSLLKLSGVPTWTDTSPNDTSITTLASAREELYRIEIAHDIFFEQLFSGRDNPDSTASGKAGPRNSLTPPSKENSLYTSWPMPDFTENDKTAYSQIYQQFWKWSDRFDLYMDRFLLSPVSPKEMVDALRTRLLQKVWSSMLDQEPWSTQMEGEFEPQELEEIVKEVELIIQLIGPSLTPVFTFDAEIIPSLALVGYFSVDESLMWRVVAILKQLNRREGVWDSQDLAEIFEAMIIARRDYGMHITGGHGGIFSVAKTLYPLNIPCISDNNSILHWHEPQGAGIARAMAQPVELLSANVNF